MQRVIPLREAAVVVKRSDFPPPVGLTHSVLIRSLFLAAVRIRVPTSVCQLYGVFWNRTVAVLLKISCSKLVLGAEEFMLLIFCLVVWCCATR